MDEVYTSEHWMVRIYKVRKGENRDAPARKLPVKKWEIGPGDGAKM